MKTLNKNEEVSVSMKAALNRTDTTPRPKIGDNDGISDKAMNLIITLLMILTMGISIATAAPTEDVKYRIILRQAMLDMDRMDYDKAITKLLEVRANTEETANVNHMLGLCYLYGEGSAEKAAFYLNRAAEHISAEYEEWDLDETNAPVQTAYHLAKAYEELQDFAKAAKFYGQFLTYLESDAQLASARTKEIISRNASKCEQAALETGETTIPVNVVLNK